MSPLDYDPFNFMIVLLFIYAVLIGFIMILIYNNIHGTRKELVAALAPRNRNNNSTSTTCANCIPAPTALKNQNQM